MELQNYSFVIIRQPTPSPREKKAEIRTGVQESAAHLARVDDGPAGLGHAAFRA